MKVRHLETSCSLEPQDRIPTRPVSQIFSRCFPQFPVTLAFSFSLLSSPPPSPPLATSAFTPRYFPLRSWGEVSAASGPIIPHPKSPQFWCPPLSLGWGSLRHAGHCGARCVPVGQSPPSQATASRASHPCCPSWGVDFGWL